MYRYQRIINLIVFTWIVVMTFNINHNPFTASDINMVSDTMTVTKKEDPLYIEISEKSSSLSEQPQNAYIDKVWKKTPGRNGLKVNVGESYKKMKKKGVYNKSLLVFDQIPPEKMLKDLPASPIFRGHPEKKAVSFLINVSWGTEHIPDILNILKEHDIKATFFIEVKWAKENVNLVNMIDEQVDIIENQDYDHSVMSRLSNEEIDKQIIQTNDVLKAITGKNPKWFAPPSGDYTDEVVQSVHDLQMETILWTVDTVDWKNPSVSVMMKRVVSNLHPGAMILMHPTVPVVNGLQPMITEIKKSGYKISTVNNLLSEER